MRVPEPLRNNPFQFRKRRSLHNILFGERRAPPLRPPDRPRDYGQIPTPATQGFSPKTYMSDQPHEYMPRSGSMQTPDDNYFPYDASEMQNMPKSDHQRVFDEYNPKTPYPPISQK